MAGQIAFSLSGYNSLFLVSLIFSGLWIIPLGWLVYPCGFIPRVIGVFLMLGSSYYVMSFAGWVIDPHYSDSLIGRIVGVVSGVPSLIGEFGTCVFLLIAGFGRTRATPSAMEVQR